MEAKDGKIILTEEEASVLRFLTVSPEDDVLTPEERAVLNDFSELVKIAEAEAFAELDQRMQARRTTTTPSR